MANNSSGFKPKPSDSHLIVCHNKSCLSTVIISIFLSMTACRRYHYLIIPWESKSNKAGEKKWLLFFLVVICPSLALLCIHCLQRLAYFGNNFNIWGVNPRKGMGELMWQRECMEDSTIGKPVYQWMCQRQSVLLSHYQILYLVSWSWPLQHH